MSEMVEDEAKRWWDEGFLYPGDGADAVQFSIRQPPELSDWVCWIGGVISFVPPMDKTPNWFHRQMQQLVFGFRWEKTGPQTGRKL